ncbi:MAG: hypothetical protein Q4G12_10100, partial [Bacteroidales bacterium]|nr:hypothetical protein [Bacteroidales bacterium]
MILIFFEWHKVMAPPTKNRGISHGISFSTTKITLKIPTFLRYGIVGEGILICVIVQTKGTVLLCCKPRDFGNL